MILMWLKGWLESNEESIREQIDNNKSTQGHREGQRA